MVEHGGPMADYGRPWSIPSSLPVLTFCDYIAPLRKTLSISMVLKNKCSSARQAEDDTYDMIGFPALARRTCPAGFQDSQIRWSLIQFVTTNLKNQRTPGYPQGATHNVVTGEQSQCCDRCTVTVRSERRLIRILASWCLRRRSGYDIVHTNENMRPGVDTSANSK